MNDWKQKLVEIALDDELCRPDNEDLLDDIEVVKALLKKDDARVLQLQLCHIVTLTLSLFLQTEAGGDWL